MPSFRHITFFVFPWDDGYLSFYFCINSILLWRSQIYIRISCYILHPDWALVLDTKCHEVKIYLSLGHLSLTNVLNAKPGSLFCYPTGFLKCHVVFVLNSTYLFKNQLIDAFDQVSKIFDPAFLLVSLNN